MNIVALKKIRKIYQTGMLTVPALLDVNLEIKKGEIVAIMGPSGSGKSTLMNIIGLLDRPTSGELQLADEPIALTMSDGKLAKLRAKKIGFVFQTFNLLPRMTALENVLLPTMYLRIGKKDRVKRALELLDSLGLENRALHHPTELSGGEKQRVAIARALVNNPDIILADEPTGNLDSKNGQDVMRILNGLNKQGKTVIIITHDPNIARRAKRIIQLLDGKIVGEKNV